MNIIATLPRVADAYLSTGVRLRYTEQGDPSGRPVSVPTASRTPRTR